LEKNFGKFFCKKFRKQNVYIERIYRTYTYNVYIERIYRAYMSIVQLFLPQSLKNSAGRPVRRNPAFPGHLASPLHSFDLLKFEISPKFLYNISIKERERKINTLSPFAENRRRTARLTYKKSITKT
jgi:hypothetical protein